MIYLDHNATTPLHPDVFRAMEPYLREQFGNASSSHRLGREARTALENSRKNMAGCLGAKPDEIIFTSGGTESDNFALRGVARALRREGTHIITSRTEHHAVLKTCQDLEQEGFRVTYLPVDSNGRIDPDDVRRHIDKETILISIMFANNETGVIQPIFEIGAIAREEQIIFHTDAVQAVGKIPVDVDDLGVDLLSVSGHKIYGPKGVGLLYIRQSTSIAPILTGGHHEHNFRAGTENIPGIVGLGEALSIAATNLHKGTEKLLNLRQRFETSILEKIDGVQINGLQAPRVPNTSNVSFQSIDGESILLHLDLKGIYASSGSACSTDSPEPSHVLLAMGVPARTAQGAIRFSMGKDNTKDDMDAVVDALIDITAKLRTISSVR
ncbi:MAG: cysteine desulfurase NifS [Deltaproteobacteria bacterium]